MQRRLRCILLFLLAFPLAGRLYSQTANLHEIRAEGMKTFTEAQVASLSGLSVGSPVSKKDLQDASDLLVRSGLFAKVTYKYDTHNDAVTLTFQVQESPRLRVVYDNLPWYSDSELNDAIRNGLPFSTGHCRRVARSWSWPGTRSQHSLRRTGRQPRSNILFWPILCRTARCNSFK